MEGDLKLVNFEQYCPKCEFRDHDKLAVDNTDDTIYVEYCEECDQCLNEPARPDSHKPLMFKEKE